jgi:hypothetical protein
VIKVQLNILWNVTDRQTGILSERTGEKILYMPCCPNIGMEIAVCSKDKAMCADGSVTEVFFNEGRDFIEVYLADDRIRDAAIVDAILENGWQ